MRVVHEVQAKDVGQSCGGILLSADCSRHFHVHPGDRTMSIPGTHEHIRMNRMKATSQCFTVYPSHSPRGSGKGSSRMKESRFPASVQMAELSRTPSQKDVPMSRAKRIATDLFHSISPESRNDVIKELNPRHFVNLTNGVEALQDIRAFVHSDEEVRFMRLQSSHCESGAYDKILNSLDDEFLFSLACGRACYVYDLASRNKVSGVPRSIFLGIQFVKWSLAYLWFGSRSPGLVPEKVLVRGKNTVPFWRDQVMPFKISKQTKRKLRYFSPFAQELGVYDIRLFGVYGRVCENDGCKTVHTKTVRNWLETSQSLAADSKSQLSVVARSGLVVHDSGATEQELIRIQNEIQRG